MGLLNNFMNIVKLFMGVVKEFGRGKESKINGEPATPILVADGEGRLKQNLREMDGSLTYILFAKPLNVT